MRDLVSCFSENSVTVSNSSCSSYSSSKNACISPTLVTPSIQNSISSIYKLVLSKNSKQLLITVTWCKSHSIQGLTISFGEDNNNPSSVAQFKLNTNSRFFRKKKGSKLLDSNSMSDDDDVVDGSSSSSKIMVFWDLSNAKYDSTGAEPVEGFYVVVVVDSEICLILGDMMMTEEAVSKRLKITNNTPLPKVTLISRREHCSGNSVYTSKAQFCESGTWHDVMIRYSLENDEQGLKLKSPILSVSIDKKTVICVKRLQWNFRGNQTIFVDGLLVDLLWDVHDWFFYNPGSSGYAVFMFRTRSGLDSRLWLEEKISSQKDKDRIEFSLLIHASKTS